MRRLEPSKESEFESSKESDTVRVAEKAPTKRSQNSQPWVAPYARDKSHKHTRREAACESDKRDRDTPFSQRSQRNRWIKFHTVVSDHA